METETTRAISTSSGATTWLSPSAAARHVGMSRRTIYNWLRAGKLHYRRTAGGQMAIDAASLWADYRGPRTPWESRWPSPAEYARAGAVDA